MMKTNKNAPAWRWECTGLDENRENKKEMVHGEATLA